MVWVQQSDHRVGPWMAWRFSESLHEKYAANLEAAEEKKDKKWIGGALGGSSTRDAEVVS